jgi:hypothetical protein
MHRYQVAKYVIFDSEKIFVKKFPKKKTHFMPQQKTIILRI